MSNPSYLLNINHKVLLFDEVLLFDASSHRKKGPIFFLGVKGGV